MSECQPSCPTSGKTPWFFSRVISRAFPEDPQAVVTLTATAVLLVEAVRIANGIAHQLWIGHDVSWGSVGALVTALAAPCALAHVKAPILPVGAVAPPAASSASSATANDVSAAGSAKIVYPERRP